MRKYFSTWIVTLGVALAGLHGPLNAQEELKVVNVMELAGQIDLQEFFQGRLSQVAVEFSEGAALPISAFLQGDLVQFQPCSLGQLEIQKTFYLRCANGDLLLSTDLVEWKKLSDFITGVLSTQLSSIDGNPSLVIGAEVFELKASF